MRKASAVALCVLAAMPAGGQKPLPVPAAPASRAFPHAPTPKASSHAPLVVGWHDEMNDAGSWQIIVVDNAPDVYAAHKGALTLRLPHVPEGFPYTYQWNGVMRTVSADLGRYPVLMAYVRDLDAGSYAHLTVEEHDAGGRTTRALRSTTITKAGLTFVDVGREWGGDVRRVTLRLIVGGGLNGARCEYDWVRFVRRADAAYLQEVPDFQAVTSTEPTGSAPIPFGTARPPSSVGFALTEIGFGRQPDALLPAPRRIHFAIEDVAASPAAPLQQMDFFVYTGSLDAPLVTLADNAGFPDVLNVYARPKTVGAMQGVLVSLILVRASVVPAKAAFALNVWQPRMPGPCTIHKQPLTPLSGAAAGQK